MISKDCRIMFKKLDQLTQKIREFEEEEHELLLKCRNTSNLSEKLIFIQQMKKISDSEMEWLNHFPDKEN